ncbi:hypothetical protein JAAARDRAFT_191878 [Jaapia argillacea MUCL 33604]|uniref:CcmS related domain-containing protein n=1 Tax=Jaapia argillacea MUCL 33604 TaxID=933084 RepID=A0A067QAH6_9AGAM|nr:hypothetical protein JAAARDRAFT_191878 [Jaapia argillacea MUCL 33604]
MEELIKAFEGRHAPVEERIILRVLEDPDNDSKRAKKFAAELDTDEIAQYSVERFLYTKDKGAIVFNIKYPYTDDPSHRRFTWVPRQAFIHSLEPTLVRQVTRYDPEHYCVILFALPPPSGLSAQVWSMEIFFSVEAIISFQVERTKVEWEKKMRKWQGDGLLELKE